MTAVAILIPGIMGSVLKLGDEVIWPGPPESLIFPYTQMAELMREDLVAVDCIRTFSFTDQYQALIDDLTACGFSENAHTLVVAAYDWRKDNAFAAQKLADHIDAARNRHGDSVKIILVAHSMGGLVSRYYLESGQFNNRPGFAKVTQLITLGTPHNGAALALAMVLGQQKRLFLSKDQVLQATSDPRYPAAYQLLPKRGEPFTWEGDVGSNLMDIYDEQVANRLGLVADNMRAAERFRAGLDLGRRPANVRYFAFSGTQQSTTTHVLIRAAAGTRLAAHPIEDEDGGDGTVPTWSAFLPELERQFVGGDHGTIYKDNGLRHVLGRLLGKPGTLAGIPDVVQLSVRDKVVEPDDTIHFSINFGKSVRDFSGILTIERAKTDGQGVPTVVYESPQIISPVEYKGLGMEAMSLTITAPGLPGFYRVTLRNSVNTPPSGSDEFIVQQAI
jgi:pimeloyl-ACP methyl ester carboxylesterase